MGDMADWDADRLYDLNDDDEYYSQIEKSYILPYLRVEAKTDDAWKVVLVENLPFEKVQCWLPKSQCEINEGVGEIEVPSWLITEKDLWNYVR